MILRTKGAVVESPRPSLSVEVVLERLGITTRVGQSAGSAGVTGKHSVQNIIELPLNETS